LVVAAIWILKESSLPKIYFRLSNKRGIPVSTLRALEKQGRKLVKLRLDVKYFESCLDLNLCPEFLKFKCPNLSVYKDNRDILQTVVRKKPKEINREKRIAEATFDAQKKGLFVKLSILEKTCLISLLNKEFEKFAEPHIVTHEKKLLSLWRKRADRCPDCIVNLSKKEAWYTRIKCFEIWIKSSDFP